MQLQLEEDTLTYLRKPQWRRQGFVIRVLRAGVEYESRNHHFLYAAYRRLPH
jgi:hypothetical protein